MMRAIATRAVLLALALAAPSAAQAGAPTAHGALARTPAAPCAQSAPGATLPAGFIDEALPLAFDLAVGLCFDAAGRLYVTEKAGRVWRIDGAQKPAAPLLDIHALVTSSSDFGLLGFAVDPAHASNGYVYALFQTTLEGRTVGRLSRFTLVPPATSIDPATERVLIGAHYADALPICSGHGIGALAFGRDGSLLVSAGDAYIDVLLENACGDAGILAAKELVGPFKSQLVDTRAGKLLRIDPRSGDGWPSNPFYDASAPSAARSQVWALGLRQPFRFALRPGTGATDPALGDPGVFVVGDVGDGAWEELDVVAAPGANFGWPLYEGFAPQPSFAGYSVANLDAPNPLHAAGVPGCSEPFFAFDDLLIEEPAGAAHWPNPCDPSQPIAGGVALFTHTRPELAWSHFGPAALAKGYAAGGAPIALELGTIAAPGLGPSFHGACSVGGAWHPGNGFPPAFAGAYFHADFGGGWIRSLRFDAAQRLQSVQPFAQATGLVIGLSASPLDGALYYLNLSAAGFASTLHRIRYVGTAIAPLAVASAAPAFGAAPLSVALSAAGSLHPGGLPLQYEWRFQKGLPPSRGATPLRTLPAVDVTALGAITTKLETLDPPSSMGLGTNPEVIRDGVYPPPLVQLPLAQFDTLHYTGGAPDKNGEDWVGYVFDEPHVFSGLVFQSGAKFGLLGGWFDVLRVQVRDASSGAWNDVQQLSSQPPYPGPLVPPGPYVHYEQYELAFTPHSGTGIRLYGAPGGWQQFVSVGELRALALPKDHAKPQNWTIELHVLDAAGATACTSVQVSTGNTPPELLLVEPAPGASFDPLATQSIAVAAKVFDAQQRDALSVSWQAFVHHADHVHPDGALDGSAGTLVLGPHGAGPGQSLHVELRCTATDALGLSTTRSVYLLPTTDCDLDGAPDALEIAADPLLDRDADGVLDACEQDCDHDAYPDAFAIALGLVPDANGNGVPDACDP
ncbi:MAG: hypothetical protein EPO68_16210 [Planctomycetota bacterium]|nr:MAG: hypothetical protein EPO68_16210 [Planctomycetota bacterium]